jgi:eukaryotic-like serine/threonine-protein kinase
MDKGNILESWKEIAAHLNRNVRTCQLWERDHGLPVHRLDGSPKARVFAYPTELDRWLHDKLHERESRTQPNGKKSQATLPTLPAWNIGLIAGLAVLAIAAIGTSAWLIHRQAKVRWANDVAIPEIERLLLTSDNKKVFDLATRVNKYIPESPTLIQLWKLAAGTLSFETDPPGAAVSVEDYFDQRGAWKPVGVTPLTDIRMAQGYRHWKAEMPGRQTAEGAVFIRPGYEAPMKIKLDAAGSLPPNMVRVPGGAHSIAFYTLVTVPPVTLEDYLLDKFEVTNRDYRAFVDAGGYRDRRFWKHGFIKDGRPIPWEEAARIFVDSTGRPGPSTWALGDYPAGAADLPVTGVSWYEAAAYAEYAGKRLPSIFHWNHAAVAKTDSSFLIAQSNLDGKALAPVGTFKGLGYYGTYDMAGNAKEWCWNESGGKRSMLGGAWNEVQYLSYEYDCYPPLTREANFGFRCMKEFGESAAEGPAFREVEMLRPPNTAKMKACPDNVFEAFRSLYAYTKADLEPRIESRLDWTPDTTVEKVSFAEASGGGRVIAYLFLPRRGRPPYQSVVYFPGSSARFMDSIYDYAIVKSREVELYTKSGRALVFPVLAGTLDRRNVAITLTTPEGQRDTQIRHHRELARCLDYLESRPDFDMNDVAYEGLSWGAWAAPIYLSLDKRFKVGILVGGGIYFSTYRREIYSPEWDTVNFAPRVKVPILMQSGLYDALFPLESSARELFRRLGTPERDKRHILYPSGHSILFINESRKDKFNFLDRYFGPVDRGAAVASGK